MAAVGVVYPALAIRSSVGVELWSTTGPKAPYEHKSNLPREETKSSRSITFSLDGRYFAFSNGIEIKVLDSCDWKQCCTLPRPKAFYMKFSPRGNYLCTWELYTVTKDKPEGSPNMFVYEMATGDEVFSIVQKKQTDWEPSWSNDETIFAMVVGGEALFYDLGEGSAGFKATTRKIGGSRGGVLSLGPGHSPPFLAFYTPGTKGAPSMCKIYKYPALAQNQTIACKSFFQADRVEMLWNKRGTGLLLLTSTEVDKSGASYYGNQALHFMSTKGDSCSVPLNKEGPVHCVKWSPKATEFLVVYGYMPSKAAMYNLKCDVVFDFGEGPRNCAYFNAFGNLVVLAGFGNLPGNVEIWDMGKREQLANMKCPDTTHFEWNPNGEYFVTATTAPRLRISNGFKVYHYSGALMHETLWPQGQELLGVEWQQVPENTFAEPIITKAKQEGIKSSQPEASKKAYTPPHLRLMQEGKNPDKYVPQPKSTIPGLPAGYSSSQQGANNRKANAKYNNQKNNKPKNAAKKDMEHSSDGDGTANSQTAIAAGAGGVDGGAFKSTNINDDYGGNKPARPYNNNNTNSSTNVNNNNYNNNRKQQQQQQGNIKKMPMQYQGAAAVGGGVSGDDVATYIANDKFKQQMQPKQQQNQLKYNNYQQQQQQLTQVPYQTFTPQHQQQYQQQKLPQQHQPQHEQQQPQYDQHNNYDQISQPPQPQNNEFDQQQPPKQRNNLEKDKKIRNVAKKLSNIKKLKARLDAGEVLEMNQKEKISKEAKLLEELKALKLSP